MGRRHNYKNLKIWKLGLEIAYEVSDVLEGFPRKEQFSLTSQLSRCSFSMPSNIAEGSARSDKGFKNFLNIALGSSFELTTQLLIAHHKKYIDLKELKRLEAKIEEWQKMTMTFQNKLEE